MTLETTESRKEYAGNGVTTVFSFPFYFIQNVDLVVSLRTTAAGADVAQILDTDYTVTGAGEQAGGSVTFAVAPAAGKTVVIYRDPAQTQGVDFEVAGELNADTLETALDKAVMLIQSLSRIVARCLRFPIGDSAALTGIVPSSVDRANKYLKFDANGEPTVATDVDIGVLSLPVPVADGGTGAATAAGARTALGAAGLTDNNAFSGANTHSGAETFTATPTIKSTGAGATGAQLTLQHDSPSPLANDLVGIVNFLADDDGNVADTVAQIDVQYNTVTGGAEDATMRFRTMRAGVRATRGSVGAGLFMPGTTDPGAGKIAATDFLKSGVSIASKIVQVVHVSSGAVGTTTGVIPNDDSIPQIGEGAEFLSLAITPTNASNLLLIEVVLNISTVSVVGGAVALFHDAVADALAAVFKADSAASGQDSMAMPLRHYMTAGTTSAKTFKVRAGPLAASTLTVNGVAGARKFGGVMASTITITEIAA